MDINILAVCSLFILCISCSYGGILSSQCKAKCMTENVQWKSSTLQAIEDCADDVNCSSCLLPCMIEYKNQASCRFKCIGEVENENKCLETCEFLKLWHSCKLGVCPKPTDAKGFEKACLPTCSNDSDCDGRKKCCFNGCGRTCQEPLKKSDDIPSKPRNTVEVSEVPGTKEILLAWSLRKNPSPTEIIYFVIEGRNNTGHHPSLNRMDTWYHVADTLEPHYKLKASRGVFYEFQIASVNHNGTLGFSRPTEPFRLSKDPDPPNMPQNLRVGESKIVNKTVTTWIYWDPPKESDLEVLRYRVFWSPRLSSISPVYVTLDVHKKNVPANQHSFAIEGLFPNTKYFVEVSTLAQWGSTRLNSERADIYLVTMDTAQPKDQPEHLPVYEHPYYELLPTPRPVRDIVNVDPPFWSNNTLSTKIEWRKPLDDDVNRYMLYWEPTLCISLSNKLTSYSKNATTHDLEFMLYGLMFDCQYKVTIHSVDSNFRQGEPTTRFFYTPLCNEVIVKGKQKPTCPTTAPDVPSNPMELSHHFSLGAKLSLSIDWKVPSRKPEMVTGYQVTWGQRHLSPEKHVVERFEMIKSETALTKTLPRDQHWFRLDNMLSGVQYVIKVQSLCEIGGGGTSTIIVKPPRVYDNTPLPPTSYRNHLFNGDSTRDVPSSCWRLSTNCPFVLVLLITIHWLCS
ncbi:anosmin-1-like isoform X2 [Antedon mediterranea]|uniref:anosmin-1-like isoform X2 n=1 Tax=Antedon mediterranea TaxID=105859 RepID=UPI003AF8E8C6